MTLAIAFWVLMLVWLVFAGMEVAKTKTLGTPTILTFILFALLGWEVFGSAIHK